MLQRTVPQRWAVGVLAVGLVLTVLVGGAAAVAPSDQANDDRFASDDPRVSSGAGGLSLGWVGSLADSSRLGELAPVQNDSETESQSPPDRFEGNDDPETATEIRPGAYGNLTLHGEEDVDVYAVELTRGDELNVSAIVTDRRGSLGLGVQPPSEDDSAWFQTRSQDARLKYYATENGTHYVSVAPWNRTGSYRMTVAVRSNAMVAPDRFDSTDADGSPPSIGLGRYEQLSIGGEDTRDVYSVDLTAGQRLTVSVNGSPILLSGMFLDIEGDGVSEGVRFNRTSQPAVSVIAPKTDRYEIRIGKRGFLSPYRLRVEIENRTDRFEPNDDLDAAAQMREGDFGLLEAGPEDLDVYAIHGSEKEPVHVEISAVDHDTELVATVRDPNGTMVRRSTGNSTAVEVNGSGEYTVSVQSPNRTAKYYLEIHRETWLGGPDNEVGRTPGFGPVLAMIGLLGSLCVLVVARRIRA